MEQSKARSFSAHLAENVRALRAARRLNQTELAEILGTVGLSWSHSTVSAVERGERAVSVDELFDLGLALNVTVAALLDPGQELTDYRYWGRPVKPLVARAWTHSILRGHVAKDGSIWFVMSSAEELKVIQLMVTDFLEKQGE